MKSDGSLRVGITIGLYSPDETLWNNGIKQNAVFLADALRRCPNVASVALVNTTAVQISSALPWDLERWPTRSFEDVKDQLDVLIELGGQIDAAQTDHLKARGCKLVSYCCGFEYVHAMQAIIFNRPLWGTGLFVNQRYDDIWMVPQVDNISRSYFETLRRRPARAVPFVWNPVFLEERCRDLPAGGVFQPRSATAKRLVVMEPNMDVVKFCLYPILIAEEFYRQSPEAVEMLYVTNAMKIATDSMDFVAIMNQLDIVRQHKAIFLGRHDTPTFLAENADIVISHQWENPLNYFYLEACWQGYPLVHNAHLCPELGYYYANNNVAQARDLVSLASRMTSDVAAVYLGQQRRAIQRFLSTDEALISDYSNLLKNLLH